MRKASCSTTYKLHLYSGTLVLKLHPFRKALRKVNVFENRIIFSH